LETVVKIRRPWGLVPIKEGRLAKGRLSPHLDARVRQDVFLAMTADVFAALSAARSLHGFAVVTLDPAAREMAVRYGGRVLDCEAGIGHNAAVRCASRELASSQQADAVLIIPMDVPLITAQDVDEILAAQERSGAAITIAPSGDLRGTNAMLLSPPECIKPLFGVDSFVAHCESATRAGLRYAVAMLPNLALDIDHREDIDRLLSIPRATQTHSALARADYRPASLGQEFAAAAQ